MITLTRSWVLFRVEGECDSLRTQLGVGRRMIIIKLVVEHSVFTMSEWGGGDCPCLKFQMDVAVREPTTLPGWTSQGGWLGPNLRYDTPSKSKIVAYKVSSVCMSSHPLFPHRALQ